MPNKNEPSFRVTKREGDGESITATRRQMVDDLKGVTLGKPVLGAIGRELNVPEPVAQIEELTDEERVIKRELKGFLLKHLYITDLGSKFKPEQVKAILRKKLDSQTLGELRRFWGGKVLSDDEMTDDKKEELNQRWSDISP